MTREKKRYNPKTEKIVTKYVIHVKEYDIMRKIKKNYMVNLSWFIKK